MGIVPLFEFQNLKKTGHSDFQEKKRQFGTGLLKIGLQWLFYILLFCAIHVVLETIKQHLRILMLEQYSTGDIFKN